MSIADDLATQRDRLVRTCEELGWQVASRDILALAVKHKDSLPKAFIDELVAYDRAGLKSAQTS